MRERGTSTIEASGVEPTQATCREAETTPLMLLYFLLLLLLRWRPLQLALLHALPRVLLR